MDADSFELIPGETNILLVAPHGVMGDDDNSGKITRKLREKLNCYAAINEYYKRPKKDPFEPTDVNKNRVDCNDVKSIRDAGLEKDWLEKIKGYRDDIITSNQKDGNGKKCYIFHIHGVDDKNIKAINKEADILLGIGKVQDEVKGKKGRLTVQPEEVAGDFIRCLSEAGNINAIIAKSGNAGEKGQNEYAAHGINKLNQHLVRRKNKLDPAIQSFQLEIKKGGFRDDDSINNTADRLAAAINEFVGIGLVPEIVEEQPDEDLAKEAESTLTGIFIKHYSNALYEAGQYVIDTFYGGAIELARDKKPVKDLSYKRLVERLQKADSSTPKKSWLYNAVNLVVQEHHFEALVDANPDEFQALGKLSNSHKLLLLTVPDMDKRVDLAVEAGEKNYPTRALAERIKDTKPIRKKSLLSAVSKPDLLLLPENKGLYSAKALKDLKPQQVETVKQRIGKQMEKLKNQLKQYEQLSQKLEKL